MKDDDHNTLDFWAVCRDFAVGDAAVGDFLATMNREVVLQDVKALSLIEQRLGDEWSPPEVSLKIDTGGLAASPHLRGAIAKRLGAAVDLDPRPHRTAAGAAMMARRG